MERKRRRISANPRGKTIFLALLFIIAPPLVFIFQDKLPIGQVLLNSLFWWILASTIIAFYETRNVVEYDGAFFYIYSWRGREKVVIPISSISSLIRSRSIQRFFYNLPNGKKEDFYVYAGWLPDELEQDLKKANPYFFTTTAAFKGAEHLFFRNEEWFK